MIAEGQWLLSPAPADQPRYLGGSGGLIDEHLLLFGSAMSGWVAPQQAVSRRTPPTLAEARNIGQQFSWKHQSSFAPASGTGYYNPAIYLPQATALWVGKKLGLSMVRSHDLARALTSLACAILVLLSLRMARFPPIALGLLGTPMALFQWYSPTIDGLTMGLTLYSTALFLSALTTDEQGNGRIVLLGICVLLIITTRMHMLPMLGLPLYLAARKRSAACWAVFACTLLGGLLWTLFALKSTIDTRVARAHSTAEIISLYLQDPGEFFLVIERTLTHPVLQGVYIKSLVGVLGWLDAPITDAQMNMVYLGLLLLLALSIWQLLTSSIRAPGVRALFLAIAACSILITFAALAATWNDYPAQVITGLQGRYFILPLFMAACALWAGPRPRKPMGRKNDVMSAPRLGGLWPAARGDLLAFAMLLGSAAITGITLIHKY